MGIFFNTLSVLVTVAGVAVAIKDTGCSCFKSNYDCGCCADIKISEIGLDDSVCVNFTYLPKDYGVSFTLTIDNHVLINQTISARNPPPICVDVPDLKKYASVCIDFYDLDISNGTFSGCIDLEARLIAIIKEKVKLGCFHVGDTEPQLLNRVVVKESEIKKGLSEIAHMAIGRKKKLSSMNVLHFNQKYHP